MHWLKQWWKKLVRSFDDAPPSALPPKQKELRQPPRLAMSWILPGKLAVGSCPRQGDVSILTEGKIKSVVSLCSSAEAELPEDVSEQFQCFRLVLPDSHYLEEIQPEQLVTVVELIHQSISRGNPVYVHCLAGVERSPTVCMAYLCRYYNIELWEAMSWLKQAHPRTMPTESQLRALRRFISLSSQARVGDA